MTVEFSLARVRRWLGDAAVGWAFVVLLPVLAGRDGGWAIRGTSDLAVAVLVASPWLVAEVRRLPRTGRVLAGAWVVALVLGVAVSGYRADVSVPLMQYAMAPLLLLGALRLWRRTWGPGLLLALVLVAFLRYEWDAWLVWWVRADDGEGVWRTLSWHNQTAALGGMVGAWCLGAAIVGGRALRVGLAAVAGVAVSGAWLSGSRAGLAATIGALVVSAVVGTRMARADGHPWRAPLRVIGGTAAVAAVVTAALLGMQAGDGGGQPLTSRDQALEGNARARVHHATAGLGMLAADPLSGGGIGSYGTMARAHNDPAGNLTVSAHNEYIELAAETGLVGGLTLLGVAAAGAWLVWGRIRRPGHGDGAVVRADDPLDLRRPLAAGATGALSLFLVHSAVDFDWAYPVLFGLAAMALAVLVAERPGTDTNPPVGGAAAVASVAVGVGLVAVLATGAVMARAELATTTPDRVGWDDDGLTADARRHLDEGQPAAALASAERSLGWNPDSPSATARAAEARFLLGGQGPADVAAYVEVVEDTWWWFAGRAEAAAALARTGHHEDALEVIARLDADLETYEPWGVRDTRLDVRLAEMAAVAPQGCEAVTAVVDRALAADADGSAPLPRSGVQAAFDQATTDLGC